MVDLTQLTQEEIWGLEFAVMRVNGADPENTTTVQEYADNLIRGSAQTHYSELIEYKTQVALNMFQSLTIEQQNQLIQQLQIPDVL